MIVMDLLGACDHQCTFAKEIQLNLLQYLILLVYSFQSVDIFQINFQYSCWI